MESGKHRSFKESLETQRAQQLNVTRIDTCEPTAESGQQRYSVLLNISTKGLEGSPCHALSQKN